MINFQLKDFVEKNIENFNPENEQDLIRAEKILKAESKLNGTFTINEIEVFLSNIKPLQRKFQNIFKISEIKNILDGKNADFEDLEIDLKNIDHQEIKIFGNEFSESFRNFLIINLKEENWRNLSSFLQTFPNILSLENLNFLKENLQDKSFQISNQLPHYQNIKKLIEDFEFSTEDSYYKLLSDVDGFYFEEDILHITNAIADYKNLSKNNKNYLGKILCAINSFESQNEDTKELLRKNKEVGLQWRDTISEVVYSKKVKDFFLDKNRFFNNIFLFISLLVTAIMSAVIIFKLNKNAGLTYVYSYIILFLILQNSLLKVFDFRKKDSLKTKFLKISGIFFYLFFAITLIFGIIGIFYYGIGFIIEDYKRDSENFTYNSLLILGISLASVLGVFFSKIKSKKK